jgi:synaptojanin
MSGNKGAVSIRLDYYDTSFCFITAHLAAGHENVDERNADYQTIVNGLHFLRGKTIDSHEYVSQVLVGHERSPQKPRSSNIIWLADLNYRIDLDNASVRVYAEDDALDMLLAADQLNYVMNAGATFSGYIEGPILFRPTYRYDLGTDNYDTSEKMRVPAWTGKVP